jgi:RNA polymerase sigma-B factor
MTGGFGVRVDRWEGTAVVSVRGPIDLLTAPVLRAVLHDLLTDLATVVVDLSDTSLLDAHSAGMLVHTRRWAAKHGSTLVLRAPYGRVARVLEITGLDKMCEDSAGAADLPASEGDDRTVETLLQARQRQATDEETRARLRQLAIMEKISLPETLARNYRGRGEAVTDLTQVATVGLIKAVDRYEADAGPGFTAYAIPTIVGEIKRHFRDKGWTIRVPRRLQEIGMALPKARSALSQRLGRSPTVAEVADALDLSEDEVIEAIDAAQVYRPNSLSTPVDGSDGTAGAPLLGDVLGAPDERYDLVDNRESLRPLVKELPEREQRILALRFYGNLTQAEIAARIGVSQMHVSRLLSRALARLREGLTADR